MFIYLYIYLFIYLFIIFERKFLLLVVRFDQLREVLSRQRILPYVSAFWLASLTGTDFNLMELSGKQRAVLTGSARDLQTDTHADSLELVVQTVRKVDDCLSALAHRSTLFRFIPTA